MSFHKADKGLLRAGSRGQGGVGWMEDAEGHGASILLPEVRLDLLALFCPSVKHGVGTGFLHKVLVGKGLN